MFINREDRDTGRRSNVNNLLYQAVRQLLKACVLNGLFKTKKTLDYFLNNKLFEIDDEDSSDEMLSEISEEESDAEIDPLAEFVRRHVALQDRANLAAEIVLRAERHNAQPYNPRSPPLDDNQNRPPAPRPAAPQPQQRAAQQVEQNVNNLNRQLHRRGIPPARQLKSVGERINVSSNGSHELYQMICPMSL